MNLKDFFQKSSDHALPERPPLSELEEALTKEQYRRRYFQVLRSTIFALVTVAAISILLMMLFFPILRIYGTSMTPVLEDGEVVIALKTSQLEREDIVAFYYNNKILVKRVIACPGEWIDIDKNGVVSINGKTLQEPYLSERALGDTDISLPYQIPEGRYFVMGDHRSVSIDSRNKAVGNISEDQLIGRLAFKIWPIHSIGRV